MSVSIDNRESQNESDDACRENQNESGDASPQESAFHEIENDSSFHENESGFAFHEIEIEIGKSFVFHENDCAFRENDCADLENESDDAAICFAERPDLACSKIAQSKCASQSSSHFPTHTF